MRIGFSFVPFAIGALLLAIALPTPVAYAKKAKKPAVYLTQDEINALKGNKPCAKLVRQLFVLRDQMKQGKGNEFFDIEILPTDEMVKGKKGQYYLIRLKNVKKHQRFKFRPAHYIIPKVDTRFRRSLTGFVRYVLAKIHGNVDYEILVLGSASATKMRRGKRFARGHVYTEIEYLKRIGPEKFSRDELEIHQIDGRFRNSDLPFLRAAYLQDIIYRYFPVQKPLILESGVSDKKGGDARTAELILYVDW